MTEQTRTLCLSLPHFAALFKAADRRGSAQWQIIRWMNILPEDVQPHDVTPFGKLYNSRTEAINASSEASKPALSNRHRKLATDEKRCKYVWKWEPDAEGNVQYQSVMPKQFGYSHDLQNNTGNPDVVRETHDSPLSTMVRISEKGNAILRRIAEEDNKTLQAVLDDALQVYEKQRFFKDLNTAYQALRADPDAWREELQERALWETSLADGLDDEEFGEPEDGTVIYHKTEGKGA
jgi:hypothetical protein